MAKGFKTGGGFGRELSFRVLGSLAQPTSPKDKDIWIGTEALTGWMFSAVEPESPYEGMVWILTGSRGAVRFDALKKNSIQLYPLRARQYVAGTWVDVAARSYIGGAWVEWLEDMALFDGGEVFEAVTGGWTGINGGSVTTDSLFIGSEGLAAGQVWTKGKVDVSGYSKLKLTISQTNDTAKAGLMADPPTTDNYGNANDGNVLALTSSAGGTLVCDISGLEGSYFIWISRATGGGTAGERSVTVAKVELLV